MIRFRPSLSGSGPVHGRFVRSGRLAGFSCEDLGISKQFTIGVLGREQRCRFSAPIDTDRRVVPQNAALVLGHPVVGSFVEEFRILASYQKTMRKARRN